MKQADFEKLLSEIENVIYLYPNWDRTDINDFLIMNLTDPISRERTYTGEQLAQMFALSEER
jgi:hypothetical protein